MSVSSPSAASNGPTAPDDEPVGSIAEEAYKLFRAVTPDLGDARGSGADHACPTSWCPVCQIAGFVRDHPEAIASVTQSATALARSLRDLVDAALTPPTPQEEQ